MIPPLAGRDCRPLCGTQPATISIHPPLAGRDSGASYGSPWRGDFNPPAPCGAGRAGGGDRARRQYFNPPAPCGAGPSQFCFFPAHSRFQSTRPLRGGTLLTLHQESVLPFQSTRIRRIGVECLVFQSTRPLRGGTSGSVRYHRHEHISIHPPLAGRDRYALSRARNATISIHPSLAGRDVDIRNFYYLTFISIHPPLRGGTSTLNASTIDIHFNPPAPCGAGRGLFPHKH